MVKLKREQKQQEELNKIKERDSFNIKCDYLTQVELRKKREQQAMIHQYYENLHNENLKLIEAKRANVYKLYIFESYIKIYHFLERIKFTTTSKIP